MIAEIINIGSELLYGDVVNTNAAWLSKQLQELGVTVRYHTVIGDEAEDMKDAYARSLARADWIFVTGGLGPTQDDLSKEILAEVVDRKMVLDSESEERIRLFFEHIGREMTPNNLRQAYFPLGARIFDNHRGTAPACGVEVQGRWIFLLPGPPREMRDVFRRHLTPLIEQEQTEVIAVRKFHLMGIGESSAEDRVMDLITGTQNPVLASYAGGGQVTFRLTGKAKTKEAVEAMMAPVEAAFRERLGQYIYSDSNENLEQQVIRLLTEKGKTIAVAESLTGGMLASALIDVAGASEVFQEGFVTYSEAAKNETLGVAVEIIEEKGIVSEEVAAAMARGAAEKAKTSVALSTTGVAGPSGGTEKTPVGTVCLGLYLDGKVKTRRVVFSGDRARIRFRAVRTALNWLRMEIQEENE
jgi:nicotinamide-nucleotide amidase